MPFRSQAQRKWMFSQHPEMAKRWAKHTPDIKKLPEHVSQKEKAAFVRSFVSTFLSKVAMTPDISQALVKLATSGSSSDWAPSTAEANALAQKEHLAKGVKAEGDIAKGEQELWKNKFFGHVATPAGLGMLGGAGLAKLFSPSNVEVDNLQKKELLAHYDSAIEELERRIASRHG